MDTEVERAELGSLLRLLVDTGRITAADAARMIVRFDLGELAVADLPVPLRDMPGRLTPMELATAMQATAVRLTPKQAAPFLAAATKPVTMATPPEVKRFLRERLRNHFRQNYDNTVAGYTHALAQGGNVALWQKKMSMEQRGYIARMTTAGRGRPLATAEIDRVSQAAIRQQGYLYKFAGEISARRAIGAPHSEAYLQARIRQYGGEGWAAWFAGNETVENRGDGYVARYTAHDDERTCGPCLDAQNGSPYMPSSGPFPGQVCRGRGLCRCRREIYFDMDAWQKLSGVAPTPTVAPVEPPIVPEPVRPIAPRDRAQEIYSGDNYRTFGESGIGAMSKYYKPWAETVTPPERDALIRYQEVSFGDINLHLRDGITASNATLNDIQLLDAMIDRSAVPYNMHSYRGLKIGRPLEVGESFSDDGYVSTSLSHNAAANYAKVRDGEAIFEVRLKAGQKGAFVDSVTSKDEYEMLLPRGTGFEVVSVREETWQNKTFKVYTAEIAPK